MEHGLVYSNLWLRTFPYWWVPTRQYRARPGASLHGELKLLVEAGVSPTRALAGATSLSARMFHLSDRGMIRSGMRADLLLVQGDPTRDVLATRNIVAVWKRGVPIDRQQFGQQ